MGLSKLLAAKSTPPAGSAGLDPESAILSPLTEVAFDFRVWRDNFCVNERETMKRKTSWLKLILLSFAIAIAAILAIMYYVNSGDTRSEVRTDTVSSSLPSLLRAGIILGVIGLIILIIKFAVKSGIEETNNSTAPPSPGGFPIPTSSSGVPIPPDGPGKYRIQGVHRVTKMDVSKYVLADSAANARVKAELEDIVVTSISKMQV
jgi:hypothetical protein